MDDKKKEVENLINSVIEPSESQKDRLQLDQTKNLNIINFINNQITKAVSKNDLHDTVVEKISGMVNTENDPEVSLIALIKLLEILNKSDNDFSLGVLNSIKDLYKIKKDGENDDDTNKNSNMFSSDFIKSVKKLVNLFEKLENSEFPETQ